MRLPLQLSWLSAWSLLPRGDRWKLNSEHRAVTQLWTQKSERRKAEAAGIGGEAYRSEGFPGGSAIKNPPTSEGDRTWRLEFNPWVGKMSWIKKWQPMLVLLPGKSHRQRSLLGTRVHGLTQSWTRLRGSTHTPTQERVIERKKL